MALLKEKQNKTKQLLITLRAFIKIKEPVLRTSHRSFVSSSLFYSAHLKNHRLDSDIDPPTTVKAAPGMMKRYQGLHCCYLPHSRVIYSCRRISKGFGIIPLHTLESRYVLPSLISPRPLPIDSSNHYKYVSLFAGASEVSMVNVGRNLNFGSRFLNSCFSRTQMGCAGICLTSGLFWRHSS